MPLLRELGRFAVQRRDAEPETIAAERFPFWRAPLDRSRTARLLDYAIFDYRLGGHGPTAVAEYLAQRGSIVSIPWRSLLETWQDVGMALYTAREISNSFVVCRRVLPAAGGDIEVTPLEQGAHVAPGSPVALRALPVASGFVYPAAPVTFGARSSDEVSAAIVARHHAYVRSQRIVSLEDFLRIEGTAFDETAADASGSAIILPGRA